MQRLIATALDSLELDDPARGVWDLLLPQLALALAGADETPLMAAAERGARGVGLTRQASIDELLRGYILGCEAVAEALEAGDQDERRAGERLLRLRPHVLRCLATGYAAGLEDTMEEIERRAALASPVDDATGAMKPEKIAERLEVEVLRCQRMDLSLGVVEMGVVLEDEEVACETDRLAAAQRDVSDCLRDNLRRYDSIGLTRDGGFLLVLPDVSRRGLAAAADRLRREVTECAGEGPQLVLALAHYDYVDVAAPDVLSTLERGMEQARDRGESLAWV